MPLRNLVEFLRPYVAGALIATGGIGAILSHEAAAASAQNTTVDISLYQLPENGRGNSSELHIQLEGVTAEGIEIKLGEAGEGITVLLQAGSIIAPSSGPAYRPAPPVPLPAKETSAYLPEVLTLSPPDKRKVFKQ